MGRIKGTSQGNRLSAYMTKTERMKKRKKKTTAWGHFSLIHVEPLPRYNR